MKANHNTEYADDVSIQAVSYITKLLNWKQITTLIKLVLTEGGCFLYNKVTKLKANHNYQVKIFKEAALFPI